MNPLSNIYYGLKPILPRSLRYRLRRTHAKAIRKRSGHLWPIQQSAARPPEGWTGWPEGKKFAVVLTHDVESPRGLANVPRLAALEKEMGFRSSFNLIPEGPYEVPPELRDQLVADGFEVGVHDLRHDGKLYRSREEFRRRSKTINNYLREWGAAGFRSAYMHHNLDWIHDLDIQYDCSTFDTDPFEPQPDGVGTIFPFWVPGKPDPDFELPSALREPTTSVGYVELPYTLAQDSTLFLFLGEQNIDVWKRKVDWIAEHGGMVLVNVHPDYISFDGLPDDGHQGYPVAHYRELLTYIRDRYANEYWHALPREVAAHGQKKLSNDNSFASSKTVTNQLKPAESQPIWIDLENTPHIPFFKPIIRELEARGHRVVLSARDAYQTCEMATNYGFSYAKIGHHYGRNRVMKLWGLFVRAAQLHSFARSNRPCLVLNHGSRTQTLLGNILGIPTVTIMDYEHSSHLPFLAPRWNIMPEVVVKNGSMANVPNLLPYSGIKEDVYVPDFVPDPSIYRELGLDPSDLVVTVRPPATEAHYHNAEAEVLFALFVERAFKTPGVHAVLLPRNKRQEEEIRSRWPHWFDKDRKVLIPDGVVNGLNLLWVSDLVVSGGGTMNREAAAMSIPVYSIFRGTIGAVDRKLQDDGRLVLIERPEEVDTRIELTRRSKNARACFAPRQALTDIVSHVEAILRATSEFSALDYN